MALIYYTQDFRVYEETRDQPMPGPFPPTHFFEGKALGTRLGVSSSLVVVVEVEVLVVRVVIIVVASSNGGGSCSGGSVSLSGSGDGGGGRDNGSGPVQPPFTDTHLIRTPTQVHIFSLKLTCFIQTPVLKYGRQTLFGVPSNKLPYVVNPALRTRFISTYSL